MTTRFYNGDNLRARLEYVLAAGVAGGSSIAGVSDRLLNEIKFSNISGLELSANGFILPAGRFLISAEAATYRVNRTRLMLYNWTSGQVISTGDSNYSVSYATVRCRVVYLAEFDTPQEIGLKHYTETARGGTGLGYAVNDGEQESYVSLDVVGA